MASLGVPGFATRRTKAHWSRASTISTTIGAVATRARGVGRVQPIHDDPVVPEGRGVRAIGPKFKQPERSRSPAWAHPVVANGRLTSATKTFCSAMT